MIELLDPRKIAPAYPYLTDKSGWSYALDYNWTMTQALEHGGASFLDVGCGKSQFGRYVARLLTAEYVGIDRQKGNDFADYQTPKRFDIIAWVSSLEHNSLEDMRTLYLRSMYYLKPGGLFLATIPVSFVTAWFEPSANMNLSPADALWMFDESELCGNYWDVHRAYRNDRHMMQKYAMRYGHYDKTDPVFIIAGVAKVRV